MNTYLIFNRFIYSKRPAVLVCFLFWLFGLFAGILLAVSSFGVCSEILKAALFKKPSAWYLVFSMACTIVFLLEMQHCKFVFSYLYLLIEALCRGFSGFLVFMIYGSGAWLIRMFFLFSGMCRSVIIWFLLFRCITFRNTKPITNLRFTLGSLLLIGLFDILVISPCFIRLISYI